MIKKRSFVDFLVRAKQASYASDDDDRKIKLPDGRKMFTFEESIYKYVDIYSGFNPFWGTETVSVLMDGTEKDGDTWEEVWVMHYTGKVNDFNFAIEPEGLADKEGAEYIFPYLQEMLMRVSSDAPFRGPADTPIVLDEEDGGDLIYLNQPIGNITTGFHGKETIFNGSCVQYELTYSGMLFISFSE